MLAAQILSILSSAIAGIAIPWLLLDAHISPDKMSWVFAVQACAAVLAAVLGTPFLDRLNRRSAYIGCDLLLALGSLALVALYLSGAMSTYAIAAILACTAIIGELSGAAGSAMVPTLLANDKVSNQRINGLLGTFHNFGDLVGPAIGGLVIAGLGSVAALSIDGASFLISALLVYTFLPRTSAAPPVEAENSASGRSGYLVGVRAIARSPVLRMVTLVSAVINMVITPLLVLLLPVMVKGNNGTALGVGTLISCFGVGTFMASVLYTARNARIPPLPSLLGSVVLVLLCFLLLPFAQSWASYLLLFLVGTGIGYLGPLEQTLLQNSAPSAQIGRVMLAYSAFRTVLVPVGFFVVGQALAHFGTAQAFIALAVGLAMTVLCLVYSLLVEARS